MGIIDNIVRLDDLGYSKFVLGRFLCRPGTLDERKARIMINGLGASVYAKYFMENMKPDFLWQRKKTVLEYLTGEETP